MKRGVATNRLTRDARCRRGFSLVEAVVSILIVGVTVVAAMNMAGSPVELEGTVNMNVLDTLGLISSSFGLWEGVEGGDRATMLDTDNFRYLNLCFDGDVLVGGQSVGLTQHVGVLRGLIQGRQPLGKWKDRLMADPSRLMEAYLAINNPAISCKVA